VNSPPPKPEVIFTNFFAEPTVLLVPITSREYVKSLNHEDVAFYIEKLTVDGSTTTRSFWHNKELLG
jgi:hypothetical protein